MRIFPPGKRNCPIEHPTLVRDSVAVQIARIIEAGIMDYYELIDRLERLPVNEVTRAVAGRDVVATQPNGDRITHVLAYLEQLAGKWVRRRAVTEDEITGIAADDCCADELLEGIADANVAFRFVPDWADEPVERAA